MWENSRDYSKRTSIFTLTSHKVLHHNQLELTFPVSSWTRPFPIDCQNCLWSLKCSHRGQISKKNNSDIVYQITLINWCSFENLCYTILVSIEVKATCASSKPQESRESREMGDPDLFRVVYSIQSD